MSGRASVDKKSARETAHSVSMRADGIGNKSKMAVARSSIELIDSRLGRGEERETFITQTQMHLDLNTQASGFGAKRELVRVS